MSIKDRLSALFGSTTYVAITPEMIPTAEGLDARRLYATQSNLYAVVSFLSDSIAQLPLKVYRRDGETERQRDRDSVAAKLLWRPNEDQTSYEFIDGLTTELLLMGVAVVWLLPDDSPSGYQLRLIPREWIQSQNKKTNYAPDSLTIRANGAGNTIEIPRDQFVMFRTYAPGNPGGYQSPIAALRQTLTEQIQADRFRAQVWRSSGRFNAYVTRPKDVQPWDDEQRKRFVKAFRDSWGPDGENAGKMPLLEDGMEIKPYQFNAKEAQYAETKQLSREDVAAAYHVNPSLIWHTSTQTYASAKDNARALYADCLGPTIQMIQQRINSFLLPMIGADPETYVEFDLTEKLKGSFEERASILQSAVGGPYMTRNEARADNNLPPVEGGDELIVPLNVVEGGQASPQDTHMETFGAEPLQKACECIECKAKTERISTRASDEEKTAMSDVLAKFFKRQADAVLPKLGAGVENWWNAERWNSELADDIEPVMNDIANAHGKRMAKALGIVWSEELIKAYMRAMAEGRAEAINISTQKKLEEAQASEDEEDTPQHVFDLRSTVHAALIAGTLAATVANWAGMSEAPHQAEAQGVKPTMEKEWVTGENPRESHAAMNGQTVPFDEEFSNGARWPGDDNLDPDESCGCNCSTVAIITT